MLLNQEEIRRELQGLYEILKVHRDRRRYLQMQSAIQGITVDPKILIELDNLEQQIRRIEQEIDRFEIQIDEDDSEESSSSSDLDDEEYGDQEESGDVWRWETFQKSLILRIKWMEVEKRMSREEYVKKYGKKVKAKIDERWYEVDWIASAQHYKDKLLRIYNTMRVLGMVEPVKLDDIFTDVYLLDKPSAWRRHSIKELMERLDSDSSRIEGEVRHTGLKVVLEKKSLFIFGKPGAGKTTFMKHLIIQSALGELNFIPIFVSLKSWSDSKLDLMDFITNHFESCSFPSPRIFLEYILDRGKAVVLFDGLDEVNQQQGMRDNVITTVMRFSEKYYNNRIVITCRTAATSYLINQFVYCELADFTILQINIFVAKWFQSDPVKRDLFLKEFNLPDNERLRELARTPLLLTLLCLTFDETMTFPPRRAEIYEEALDALLKKWDASRSIRRDVIYRKLSLGHKRQLLTEIAAETFEHGEIFMRESDIAPRIVAFLKRLPPPDVEDDIDGVDVLRAIETQHGLLVERAQSIYSFSHLSFHEYFTARYIVENPSLRVFEALIKQVTDTRWREVLLLTASMLNHQNAEKFFQVWKAVLDRLIREDTEIIQLLSWLSKKAPEAARFQWVAQTVFLALELELALSRAQSSIPPLTSLLERTRAQASVSLKGLSSAGKRVRNLARDKVIRIEADLAEARLSIETLEKVSSYADRFARTSIRALARTFGDVDSISQALDLARSNILRFSGSQSQSLSQSYQRSRNLSELFAKYSNQKNQWMTDIIWVAIVNDLQSIITVSQLDPAAISTQLIYSYISSIQRLGRVSDSASEPLVVAISSLELPELQSPPGTWSAVTGNLHQIIANEKDVGHHWSLSKEHSLKIMSYISNCTLMVEALELASIANRDELLNDMFFPVKVSITNLVD